MRNRQRRRGSDVDAGWFGGYIKPANLKVERRDRCVLANQNGKRQAVIIIRERSGNSVPAIFRSESAALGFVKARIAKGHRPSHRCFTFVG